jgi:hypothetical protein
MVTTPIETMLPKDIPSHATTRLLRRRLSSHFSSTAPDE